MEAPFCLQKLELNTFSLRVFDIQIASFWMPWLSPLWARSWAADHFITHQNEPSYAVYSTARTLLGSMTAVRPISRMIQRTLSLHTKPLQFPPAQCAPPIPQHELVDEEASPAYNPKYFYPAKPGEILANHYQLLVKIGWGTRSTTWLAKDITRYTPNFAPVMPIQ